jgi:hypothetical protein
VLNQGFSASSKRSRKRSDIKLWRKGKDELDRQKHDYPQV